MKNPTLISLLLLPLLALIGFSAPAEARVLGDAETPYSAERSLTVDGQTYDGKLYAVPGHQRHEQNAGGLQEVAILDLANGTGAFIVPSIRSYIDFKIDRALAALSDPGLTSSPMGHERIAGIATTEYRVNQNAKDGTRIEGHIWLTVSGIAMRAEGAVIDTSGKRTRFSWLLSDVRTGKQDDSLFRIPAGFYRLPLNGLPSFLGSGSG